MQPITYGDALGYLYSFTDYEKRGFAAYAPEFYNLDRMRRFLALLGDPQDAFAALHIAGTKGKGSTAALAESILRAAGLKTGLYTSPHLHTFRERMQACGELIPEEDVVRLVETTRPLVAQVADITTFEIMTGLAFTWFAEQGVGWAVLEVGLGGRLDATNVVLPRAAVITSISLDHVAVLGDTLARIAAEKAGIVKAGIPVVSAPQPDEAWRVIEEVCREKGAPLSLLGRDWTWQPGAYDLQGQHLSVRHEAGAAPPLEDAWIPLLGEHQLVNAATAVAAAWEAGLRLAPDGVRRGLAAVRWPARLEILSREPLIVADSAHNGDSAQKLVEALERHCTYRHLIVVLGGSADHATPELFRALLPVAQRAIATRSRHARAAAPAWFRERAGEMGFQMESSESIPEALEMALGMAGVEDLICCTGSVFVAAEAREAWFARQGLPLPPVDPT
jgi:dihydrofolate synthase / folylpolyglutamate synthase